MRVSRRADYNTSSTYLDPVEVHLCKVNNESCLSLLPMLFEDLRGPEDHATMWAVSQMRRLVELCLNPAELIRIKPKKMKVKARGIHEGCFVHQ